MATKRKETDLLGPNALSRAAGKRKIGDEEGAFVDDDGPALIDLIGLDGGLDGGNLCFGEEEGGNDDDLEVALRGSMSDSLLAAGLEPALVPQYSDTISEIPESESEDNIEILSVTEDELRTSEKLDFSAVTLSPSQARLVAQLIAENPSLSTILFDGHELQVSDLQEEDELEWDSEEYTDVEAIIIAELLKKSECSVKRLDLARNQITDHGAKALAEMLEMNSMIEYLNLESNMISEKGGAAFGRAVTHNSSLQYLNLQYNSIPATRQQDLRDVWQGTAGRGQLGLHL